jgi:very-short-patch-repair endonuclease
VREISLPADEITTRDGIPVTTVARTLLDLASVLDRQRLAHAVGEAEKRLLADSPSLPVLIERHRGARGLATLRAILGARRIGLDVPKSELEIEFQSFLRARGLPSPEVNAWVEVGGRMFEIDCLWREQRLAVELDSREHHSDRLAFERDRARDSALLALGIRTLRVTARRLATDADRLELELRAAASGRGCGR